MIRVAVIADQHFDESSRWEEGCRVHEWIATEIARRGVDVVCLSGDLFERKSTPRERNHVAAWLCDLARVAQVVGVYGNHEAAGDLDVFNRLDTRYPLTFYDRPAVHLAGRTARPGELMIACLPWPRKAMLAAHLGHASLETVDEAAGDALRGVLRGFGQVSHEGPRLLLAHAMVRGSRTSTGQPLVGCDMEIGVEDLALSRADAVALGHVHAAQSWDVPVDASRQREGWDHTIPVIYPGSPRRTAFGEVEAKGFVILTMHERSALGVCEVEVERIATPCAPMLLLTAVWRPVTGSETPGFDGGFDCVTPNDDVRGAEIRFRYEVRSDLRDAARRGAERFRAQWLAAGAAVVKVEEEVIAETRARAPEIAAARTVEEKLRAMYAHQGVAAERAELLVTRARSLEAA